VGATDRCGEPAAVTGRGVDVLVVGAGPTGLALALQVLDHGANVRIIERRPMLFRPSRAMIMHPRTLEVLRPSGVTDALLDRGNATPSAELHLGHRDILVPLADFDLADTAFPHLLLIRQTDVETVLCGALAERGVQVERGTELIHVGPPGAAPEATVARGGVTEEIGYRYLVGCDGTGSTVRRLTGVPWLGAWYSHEVVLADVELDTDLAEDVVHVVPGRHGLLFAFPIAERATWRIMTTRETDPTNARTQSGLVVPDEELRDLLDDSGLRGTVKAVGWSSQVRLQHRIASTYRCGRLFLAGDAAHANSPAGAQGMNIGIQDAVNLGWKLAFAAGSASSGPEPEPLLDSYDVERRPVAQHVLAATRALYWAEAGTDPVARFARNVLAPLGAPAIVLTLQQRRFVSAAMRTVSQLRTHYRHSPLSVDGTPHAHGGPRPGDRLPDHDITLRGRHLRLHELTATPGIHVLLQRQADPLERRSLGPLAHTHRIPDWPGHGVLLIRPDGYVGFRCAVADETQITNWLAALTAPNGGPLSLTIPRRPRR
jgi:2-polyprenyl-6-methoxyphenol hydroxylase-like FAD-dependent oxidoreductase